MKFLNMKKTKSDKMSVKKTHNILKTYIDVIICLKFYI
jgi:hypothetical protein